MADFVDKLSDAELRTKLAEYGFPVVPITTTTRKVMTKKLKMLIENKNKINTEGRRSLAKYSSEEESDDDVKSKRDKNRRITMAAGMLPPVSTSKATRKSTRKLDSHNDSEALASSTVTTETKTRRTTRLIKPVEEADLETGSDSEPEVVDEYINNSNIDSSFSDSKSSIYTRPYLTPRSPLSTGSTPEKPFTKTGSTSTYTSSSTRYSSSVLDPGPATHLGGGDSSVDRLNQIRSRLSLGGYDRKIAGGGAVPDDVASDTPFLSNFSKRLSQLSSTAAAPKPDFSYKNDVIKEHDANGTNSYNRSYLTRIRNRSYPMDFKSRQEKNIFKNNFVSFTLLGIAVAFFIGIAVMYVGIRSDQSAVQDKADPWQ